MIWTHQASHVYAALDSAFLSSSTFCWGMASGCLQYSRVAHSNVFAVCSNASQTASHMPWSFVVLLVCWTIFQAHACRWAWGRVRTRIPVTQASKSTWQFESWILWHADASTPQHHSGVHVWKNYATDNPVNSPFPPISPCSRFLLPVSMHWCSGSSCQVFECSKHFSWHSLPRIGLGSCPGTDFVCILCIPHWWWSQCALRHALL